MYIICTNVMFVLFATLWYKNRRSYSPRGETNWFWKTVLKYLTAVLWLSSTASFLSSKGVLCPLKPIQIFMGLGGHKIPVRRQKWRSRAETPDTCQNFLILSHVQWDSALEMDLLFFFITGSQFIIKQSA